MHIERAKWYKHIAFIYCIAKNIEKRKEKNLQAPGVDRGYFPMRTYPLAKKKEKMNIYMYPELIAVTFHCGLVHYPVC